MARVLERSGNYITRNWWKIGGAIGGAALLAACSSSSSTSAETYPGLPPDTCSSHASYSQVYPGDPAAKGKPLSKWMHGIVAHTRDLPTGTGYEGMQMGWYTPGPDAEVHWSTLIQGPPGKNVFAFIGGGPVGYEVRLIMKADNTNVPAACTETPDTKWFPKSPQLGDVAQMEQEQWFTPSAEAKFAA